MKTVPLQLIVILDLNLQFVKLGRSLLGAKVKVYMQMLTFFHLLINSGKKTSNPFVESQYHFSSAFYR